MSLLDTALTRDAGIRYPIICGAMYPASNPELVAAASEAGGIGIVQPISLTYVHKHELREGLQAIRRLTDKPIGFNALIEQSSKVYEDRMRRWVDVALEEGIRFFITALGNPRWVVDKVHAVGGKVYHDVTERKWAEKGLAGGVDGLICVNGRAGGHAGSRTPEALYEELADLDVPLVAAGGVGGSEAFVRMLELGYAGVQMGTRFIATPECQAHDSYKRAIVDAGAADIVLTHRLTGVPVSVIATDYVKKVGTDAGWLARRLLKGRKTKHWVRTFYSLRSLWQLDKSLKRGTGYQSYFQAGKSVDEVHEIRPVADIISEMAEAARRRAA